jgi:putative ABC transport system substrate-binding protein
MENRRRFVIALGTAASLPRTVFAQAKHPPVVIGWLNFGSRESLIHHLAAFKEGLAALGLKEGQQFVIEERWADQRRERLQPLAEELAARRPAVIVAVFTLPVSAAAKAAPTTPIVWVGGGDPVRLGFAKTLARPGGMITGVSSVVEELREKYLELLVDAVPKLRQVGVILDSYLRAFSQGRWKQSDVRRAARSSCDSRYPPPKTGRVASRELGGARSCRLRW